MSRENSSGHHEKIGARLTPDKHVFTVNYFFFLINVNINIDTIAGEWISFTCVISISIYFIFFFAPIFCNGGE